MRGYERSSDARPAQLTGFPAAEHDRTRLFVLMLLLAALACLPGSPSVEPASEQADINVFVRQGCPHCAEAKRVIEDLQRDRPRA
jgi:hypothetical protein